MISAGNGGSIVNISSQASQVALKDHAVYCEFTSSFYDNDFLARATASRNLPTRATQDKVVYSMPVLSIGNIVLEVLVLEKENILYPTVILGLHISYSLTPTPFYHFNFFGQAIASRTLPALYCRGPVDFFHASLKYLKRKNCDSAFNIPKVIIPSAPT